MENVIASTILLILFLCVRRFFDGRISARLQYGLWLLVAVRLLFAWCPLPESSFSLMNLLPGVQQVFDSGREYLSEDFAQQAGSQSQYAQDGKGSAVEGGELIDAAVQGNEIGVNKESTLEQQRGKQSENSVPERVNEGAAEKNSAAAGGSSISRILWGIYAVGAGFAILLMVVQNIRFWLGLRRRRILCKEEVPVAWLPGKLYLLEDTASPFLFGRSIYIAPDMLGDKKRLCHTLTHEVCHWRQGDAFWPLLRNICLAMYWFHPLVWYGARLSRADAELACDERVIRILGEENRICYGETLLQLIRQQNARGKFSRLSTMMSGDKRDIRKRIDRIAGGQRNLWTRVLFLAISIFAILALTIPGQRHTSTAEPMAEENVPEQKLQGKSLDGKVSGENVPGEEKQEDSGENEKRHILEARSTRYEIYVMEGVEGGGQNLYVYDKETEQTNCITVGTDISNGIMSLEWLAPDIAAVFSHVSPYTGCLSIYALETKKLIFERYCSRYAWHDNLQSIVYVEPTPHFSGKEKILDMQDRVLYQTGKWEAVSEIAVNSAGELAVVTKKDPSQCALCHPPDDNITPVNRVLILRKRGKKYHLIKSKKMKGEKNISDLQWLDDGRIAFDVNGKHHELTAEK